MDKDAEKLKMGSNFKKIICPRRDSDYESGDICDVLGLFLGKGRYWRWNLW